MKHFVPKADRPYNKTDFQSDQMVRWCPGCGNHAILKSLLDAFPQVDHKKENICMVSGIGCSSRIPYYVDTYGFHSIHGRACAVASGMKLANPSLSLWVSMGDGDALAIGGNHLIHALRRNQDLNIILFNNEIYGLTKGQYSPTTKFGQVTKTSPFGTIDYPFNPGELVLGAQGSFFARSLDVLPQLTTDCLVRAAAHDGASVVEVLQNCVIFNDRAHAALSDPSFRADRTIVLRHGEPMLFGQNHDRGLIFNGHSLQAVTIGHDGISLDDILVHHEDTPDPGLHLMLARMSGPLPVALGVIRNVARPSYTELFESQMEQQQSEGPYHSVDELLNSGTTWEV